MADDLVDPEQFNTYGQGYKDGAVDRRDGLVPDPSGQPNASERYVDGYRDGYAGRAPRG